MKRFREALLLLVMSVVAIIGILAAVALPRNQDTGVRAKMSRSDPGRKRVQTSITMSPERHEPPAS